MYGVLDAVASGPIDARTSENSTMVKSLSFHKKYFVLCFLSNGIIQNFKLFMILYPLAPLHYYDLVEFLIHFLKFVECPLLFSLLAGFSLAGWCWNVHGRYRTQSSCV